MRRVGALTAAAVLVLLAGPVAAADESAGTPVSTAAIEQKLADRTARLDAALDAKATTAASALEAKVAEVDKERQERRDEDKQEAQAFREDDAGARRAAWRGTGAWLAVPGAGLLALGAFAWKLQTDKQSAITSGGFATGSDIGSAATGVNVYRATAITALSVGAPMLFTGIGLFLFGPAGVRTQVAGLRLQDGSFVW